LAPHAAVLGKFAPIRWKDSGTRAPSCFNYLVHLLRVQPFLFLFLSLSLFLFLSLSLSLFLFLFNRSCPCPSVCAGASVNYWNEAENQGYWWKNSNQSWDTASMSKTTFQALPLATLQVRQPNAHQ
jgi:hypothetical protein